MHRCCYVFLLLSLATGFFASESLARRELRVGIRAVSPPFSFLAVQEGEQGVRGYSIDEWVLLGELIAADIEFVLVDSLDDFQHMYSEGRIDLMAHGSRPSSRSRFSFIPLGYSLRNHLFINVRSSGDVDPGNLQGKRVVAISGAPYSPKVKLGDDVVQVSSPLEALSMLEQGVVEVFAAPSERVADYLVAQNGFDSVVKHGHVLGEIPLGISVSNHDRELLAELRQAVKHLRETGHLAQLRDKWFGRSSHASELAYYAKHIVIAVAAVCGIFVCIVLWNMSLKRRVNKAASDLKRTEQRYRDLIESSPDIIFLVNEHGDILHANERAQTFLQFPERDGPVNLKELTPVDDADEIAAFLTKVYNDGCDKHEFKMLGVSGHALEVEIAGRVIQGPLQAELLACLFARNVTERNRMEEELIQSERLGIIGKMAAGVAHEINNPLGIIQANAEDLLYEVELEDDVKEGLSAIQRNAIRAGEITKGLLEAASPKPMTARKLDVGGLLREAISLLGPKAKTSDIEVVETTEPLCIKGDSRALQQVVVNLLFNSLASMGGRGVIRIHVCRQVDLEHETVRVVVEDTGKGIPRENLPRIFEPFFTSRKAGFGLGLFITRRMVERHEGLVFAESEEGVGTRMILEFPACRQEDKENA